MDLLHQGVVFGRKTLDDTKSWGLRAREVPTSASHKRMSHPENGVHLGTGELGGRACHLVRSVVGHRSVSGTD